VITHLQAVPKRERLDAEQRRARIVETAIQLFADKGFRGTTTRELATAVGVTEAVLYQHFPSKRDLYEAILQRIVRTEETHPDELLQRACERGDDLAFFKRLAQLVLDWHEQTPALLRLVLYAALEGHELAQLFFERQILRYYDMVTRYVQRRQNEGALRRMDPKLVVGIFTGMIGHFVFMKVVFGADLLGANRDAQLNRLVSVFLEGVRTQVPNRRKKYTTRRKA